MSNDQELDKKIGQRIRDCRLTNGYSQSDLAKILGFDSPTAISLIEQGERSLKIRDLITLSELFMKNYEYFIGPKHKIKKSDGVKKDADIHDLARRLLRMARSKG